MNIPAIETFEPSDNCLLEFSERTRIQMSVLYFAPNYQDHYLLDETAPDDLLEVVALYRRNLGKEVAEIGGGDTLIETLRPGGGHHWIQHQAF